jgi:hypothetical protein
VPRSSLVRRVWILSDQDRANIQKYWEKGWGVSSIATHLELPVSRVRIYCEQIGNTHDRVVNKPKQRRRWFTDVTRDVPVPAPDPEAEARVFHNVRYDSPAANGNVATMPTESALQPALQLVMEGAEIVAAAVELGFAVAPLTGASFDVDGETLTLPQLLKRANSERRRRGLPAIFDPDPLR